MRRTTAKRPWIRNLSWRGRYWRVRAVPLPLILSIWMGRRNCLGNVMWAVYSWRAPGMTAVCTSFPGRSEWEPPLWMKSQKHTVCLQTSMKKKTISTWLMNTEYTSRQIWYLTYRMKYYIKLCWKTTENRKTAVRKWARKRRRRWRTIRHREHFRMTLWRLWCGTEGISINFRHRSANLQKTDGRYQRMVPTAL